MLQFLSTMSPPRRFGQPPDSLRIISDNFPHVSSGQPACSASIGNHETSPCLNTIEGVTVVWGALCSTTKAGGCAVHPLSTGFSDELGSAQLVKNRPIDNTIPPSVVFKLSPVGSGRV